MANDTQPSPETKHAPTWDDNPYRSPCGMQEIVFSQSQLCPSSDGSEAPICIQPRIMPRDLIDVAIGLLLLPYHLLVLFALPTAIVFCMWRSWVAVLVTPALVYLTSLAFLVRSVTFAADGIRFNRLVGSPKFLPWNSISSVETASRRDLIIKGWLWPLFPMREMSASMTSLGHFRISWGSRFYFYPPVDAEEFERQVHSLTRVFDRAVDNK